MNILVTGGAGYIGSHFVRKILKEDHKVFVIDNLSRGHIESIPSGVIFIKQDILDYDGLNNQLQNLEVEVIVHFAAFAYVGESVENPSLYYYNNVAGSLNLIKTAAENNIKKFVFSSTCSVYGNPEVIPISENELTKPINPYANTKLMIEQILNDFDTAYGLKYVALRYFNAAGASFDGSIGESHYPEPHLIPLVIKTALGEMEKIYIYGNDYKTKDGTCIRDYIHVDDLADAHLKAIEFLNSGKSDVFNLGTGTGYSVREIIETAEKITKMKIDTEITDRRHGDPAVLVANNEKANRILGWEPKFNLKDIISSAFNWHKNPKY